MKELYPEVDANRVIREGSYDFGLYQGQQIADKFGGGENVGPKEALLAQTSRGGLLVFEQEIKQLDDDKAVKIFNCCPSCGSINRNGLE